MADLTALLSRLTPQDKGT